MVNIVVAAQESAGIHAVRAVAASEHRLVGVLTGPSLDGGRGVEVASVAAGLDVPILPARSVRHPVFAEDLRGMGVDVLLNVHSLHVVVDEVLAAPRVGCFNLHPGPLPEFAGLNVPCWAVYQRRERHGVTLHWMAAGVDTGPVAYAADFAVSTSDTGLSVFANCARHGAALVSDLLGDLGSAVVPAVRQDLRRRRYYGREVPYRGWVPWDHPAAEVAALVRACDFGPFRSPWGVPRTVAGATVVGVPRVVPTGRPTTAAPGRVETVDETGALVATADEWVRVPRLRVDDRSIPSIEILRAGDTVTAPQ